MTKLAITLKNKQKLWFIHLGYQLEKLTVLDEQKYVSFRRPMPLKILRGPHWQEKLRHPIFTFIGYSELEILLKRLFCLGVVCPQTNESMWFDIGIINVQALKLREKRKTQERNWIYIFRIDSCSVFIVTELNVIITILSEHTHLFKNGISYLINTREVICKKENT